jgi:hypothetical protein
VIAALQAIKPKWSRVKRKIPCGSELFRTDDQKAGERVDGFDASIFLRSRWWPEFKELGILEPPALRDEKDAAKRQALEQQWRRSVEESCLSALGPKRPSGAPPRILDLMAEPYPYVACLAADGDVGVGLGG